MTCDICGVTAGTEHLFREMMFGTRNEFSYWECSSCGCLQIAATPNDMSAYYPDDYYSFASSITPLQLLMYRAHSLAPRLGERIRPAGVTFRSVLDARPKARSRILDVGCGSGRLVTILRSLGFDAQGIDPFVKTETAYVHRVHLGDAIAKDWDLIMFHHSLEHMTDHIRVLRAAWEKLAADGTCLVRIPVANWAWRHYRENWIQLDPPRHFVIHTPESFRIACAAAGFKIDRVTFDSGPFQFYGSELYQRGISLKEGHAEEARLGRPAMRSLQTRAAELNRQQLGDQASFYLKKITTQ